MQCLYLTSSSSLFGHEATTCNVGSKSYDTTEQDRGKFCTTEDFHKCPRFLATVEMNKSKITIIECNNNTNNAT